MTFIWALLYIAVVVQISNLCTTIYLHRSLAHRSLNLKPAAATFMRFWLWLHVGINPREWVAVHRKHHRFSDEEGDPHSPLLKGVLSVLFGNVYFYRKEAKNPETVERYTRDMPKTRMEVYLHRYSYWGLGVGLALAIGLLGVLPGLLAFAAQAVLYVFLNGMINGVCHALGYRNFDNTATNLRWVAWLTAGEGLHNNHHHAPASPKLSYRISEIDPAWLVILCLRWLRLVEIKTSAAMSRQGW